ncbi:MAG TPA: DNA repair protein RecN [Xanthomonadales bacterium]|nr:DNA repair protein RecN [Xanthomonadales bacterium]
MLVSPLESASRTSPQSTHAGAMLSLLQIRNFAIVEALDLELKPGFSAITGETGAGKSILVDALGLLLGGRADSGAIRGGGDKAELTAEFELEPGSEALDWLRQAELQDGDSCLLRRVISDSGRSRAWINGTAVTLSQLQELGECLVEIHGQNEHVRLLQAAEQFRLLDADPTCSRELENVAARYAEWRAVEQAIAELDREAPLSAGELDFLRYQIDELEGVALKPEVYGELDAEHQLLARGGDIVASLQSTLAVLEADQTGIGVLLHQSVARLARYKELDREVANAVRILEEAAINCEEARTSLQAALSRIDLSPERFEELERSMSRLHDLARKHRAEPAGLLGVLERLRERHELAGTQQERLQTLREQRASLLGDYRAAAGKLHAARQIRAAALSRSVSELLPLLGMEGGVFELQLERDPDASPSRRGDNRLELLVSTNPGMPPDSLRKVASGGELSRISLAIKVASSAGRNAPTQVFDEVDAGIGGETANSVGRLLQSVARGGQALCVTHLAQVAVCADQQFRVLKNSTELTTQVETNLLSERERVDEIARMLGGRLSEQSRAHARELLSSALTRH